MNYLTLILITVLATINLARSFEIDIANGHNVVKFETNPSAPGEMKVSTDKQENQLVNSIATLGYKTPSKIESEQLKNIEQLQHAELEKLPERFNQLFLLRNRQQKNEALKKLSASSNSGAQDDDFSATSNQHIFITNINKNVNDFMQQQQLEQLAEQNAQQAQLQQLQQQKKQKSIQQK